MRQLSDELLALSAASFTAPEVAERCRERISQGRLTREENPLSHSIVYLVPCNPATHEVFIVHHRKAGEWLVAGGHSDPGESLAVTAHRKAQEELGVTIRPKDLVTFFLTVTNIDNAPQVCREHLDVWFFFKTNGRNFVVDSQEFVETRWVTFSEARQLVTDPSVLKALKRLEDILLG